MEQTVMVDPNDNNTPDMDRLRAPAALLIILLLLAGCSPTSSFISLAANLNRQSDLELFCEGAPAFLLVIDNLIAEDPGNADLLQQGVQAYAAYDTAVGECGRPERSAALSAKAYRYGLRLLRSEAGITSDMPLPDFSATLQTADTDQVGPLFWGAYGWALWITDQGGAPAAMADIPRVEQLMQKVIFLDEHYFRGGAHLFLGIYYGSRQAMYGGDPDRARHHFERALAISQGSLLAVQVAYAENYAKQVMDRDLFQRLLQEVLDFDATSEPELTLSNLVAKRRARHLLDSIDEYF